MKSCERFTYKDTIAFQMILYHINTSAVQLAVVFAAFIFVAS